MQEREIRWKTGSEAADTAKLSVDYVTLVQVARNYEKLAENRDKNCSRFRSTEPCDVLTHLLATRCTACTALLNLHK